MPCERIRSVAWSVVCALALTAASGCLFDDAVPADAVITCDDSSECPSGLTCAANGRCVADALETVAPSLVGEARIAPLEARVGTALSLTIEASEALGQPPAVTLTHAVTGDTRTMATGDSAPPYTHTYVVTELDAPGEWRGRVSLVDEVGNVGEASVGNVTVDTRAPGVVSASNPEPAIVSSAVTTVAIDVVLDEAAAAPPVLVSRGADAVDVPWRAVASEDAAVWRFDLTPSPVLLDGVHGFSLTAVDAAGNESTTALAISLVVDRSAPSVNVDVVDGADTVRAPTDGHDTVVLEVDAGEVGADIALPVGTCDVTGTTTAACTYVVTAADDPFVTLDVIVTDAAGNATLASVAIPVDASGPSVPPALVTLALTPGAGNPLANVTRATVATTVDVSFQTNEPLAAPPVVALGGVAMEIVSTLGTAHAARIVVAAGAIPEGPASLTAELRDALGNSSVVAVALVAIDTTAPAALDGARNDAVLYERDGAGARVLSTAGGALEPDALLLVVTDDAAHNELARGASDGAAGGFAPITLPTAAHVTIAVAQVDAAGNRSPPARVRHIDFVERTGGSLATGARTALLDDVASAPDAAALGAVTPAPRFERVFGPAAPTAAGLLYDDVANELVVYSGGGTFRFDGARYRPTDLHAPPLGVPIAGARGLDLVARTEFVDGSSEDVVCDELCDQYNGYTREHDRRPVSFAFEWTGDALTTTASEQGWSGRTPILDANGELVLLGGAALLHERWTEFVEHMFGDEYNRFIDNLTIDIAVSVDPPVAREAPSAALDTDRDVIVLFGGARTSLSVCGAGGTDPGGCFLDYDHSTNEEGNLFYWALYPSSADPFDDTWERAPDGTWSEIPFSDPEGDGQPPAMSLAWMAYDPLTARTLLHDGTTLWSWDGTSWAQVPPNDVEGDGEPPAPFGASTFDPARDRLVVSAGNALWTFEGASFARLGASGGEQPNDGALLVHPVDRSLYLVDPDASVALWQLGAREWVPVPASDPEADGDPARSALVAPVAGVPGIFDAVFAALDGDALWTWDGASWTQRALPPSPPPRALVNVDGALLAFGDEYVAPFIAAAGEWDYQSLGIADLGLGSSTQFTLPELKQVDVLPAGLALTFVHDAGTSVVLTDVRTPPLGGLAAVTVAGFGFADCFGSRCSLGGQLETCTGETGWAAPTPAVLALGDGTVLLFGGGETGLSLTERNDVGPCTIPEFYDVDLRTLGPPGLLCTNPGAAVADPENDARPTGAFSARSAHDPVNDDVWALEGSTVWRATLGVGDVPAVALTADPRAAGLPLAQLASIAVDVTGAAPSGVRLVRWNSIARTWDDAAPAGGPTFALDVDAADLASLWDDTRDPLRLAVRPIAAGPVSVASAAVRSRFVLP